MNVIYLNFVGKMVASLLSFSFLKNIIVPRYQYLYNIILNSIEMIILAIIFNKRYFLIITTNIKEVIKMSEDLYNSTQDLPNALYTWRLVCKFKKKIVKKKRFCILADADFIKILFQFLIHIFDAFIVFYENSVNSLRDLTTFKKIYMVNLYNFITIKHFASFLFSY